MTPKEIFYYLLNRCLVENEKKVWAVLIERVERNCQLGKNPVSDIPKQEV